MEYTIKEVANMANISNRTLRYYDQINLLNPSFINASGYRIYTSDKIDLLQQILFYKELDFNLDQIKEIITNKSDIIEMLYSNYELLQKKKKRIQTLLDTILHTIESKEKDSPMSDKEKFTGFKEKQIKDNENKYGKEVRETYGDKAMDDSNKQIHKMSPYQIKHADELAKRIKEELALAMNTSIDSEKAFEVCSLHQEWIQLYWGEYTTDAHMALVEMYLVDDRFKAYYEKVRIGATEFLRDAMKLYLKK